ncbi:MAG: hypothetical protein WB383_03545 [Acidimicrobiales bacterium]
MGLFDALLGRTKPAQANLDRLFGLPGAQITLEAAEGLQPTGQAGVCFKPAEGQAFTATETEFTALLNLGDDAGAHVSENSDQYGYRWVVLSADDFQTLVTRVHVTNSTLQDNGFGPQLLCSVFGFAPTPAAGAARAAATVYLVYLYKRGTFYPFVPAGGERRDNEAELRLKNELGEDLSIEPDLSRWFPIWGLPVH